MKTALRALLVAVCSTLLSVPALAEDAEVTQRLQSHGGLSGAAAKRLSTKVAQRMMKSADTLAPPTDPVRVAMSQSLFHAAVPPDNMAAAKMRLKLYAGLNVSTLEMLFLPKPGAIASCVRAIGATQAECEALVAAAGRESVADARNAAAGPAVAAAPMAAARPAPAAAPAAAASGNARFGRFNSGFQGAAPAPTYAAAAPTAKPATTQFGAARPVAAAPQPSGMSRKEAYQAQREAYLARQKAIHDERKQKLGGAAAGEADAPPPAAAAPAAVAAAPAKTAPAAKTKPSAAAPVEAVAVDEAPVEEAPAEVAKSGPALEGDFLNDLLADPLGKK